MAEHHGVREEDREHRQPFLELLDLGLDPATAPAGVVAYEADPDTVGIMPPYVSSYAAYTTPEDRLSRAFYAKMVSHPTPAELAVPGRNIRSRGR